MLEFIALGGAEALDRGGNLVSLSLQQNILGTVRLFIIIQVLYRHVLAGSDSWNIYIKSKMYYSVTLAVPSLVEELANGFNREQMEGQAEVFDKGSTIY